MNRARIILRASWALALGSVVVAPAPGEELERGGVAPRGCWCTESGCVARTAHALGDLQRGDLFVDWQRDFRGTLEGAPRVWHDFVLVGERESEESCRLHLLDLESGRTLDGQQWASPRRLEACVWNRAVAVRTGVDRISVFDFATGRLRQRWSERTRGECSGPLLLGRELFVREGGDVVARDATNGRERWRCPANVHGELSYRGGRLYAVEYRGARAELIAIDAGSGARLDGLTVARHADGPRPRHLPLRIQVMDHHVLVRHVQPVLSSNKSQNNTTVVERRRGGDRLGFLTLLNVIDDAVPWAAGWMGELLLDGREPVLALDPAVGAPYEVLAGPSERPRLVRPGVAPARVGQGFWSGSRLVDLDTRELLARLPFDPAGRPVPARDRVLVRRADRVLACCRAPTDAFAFRPRLVSTRLVRSEDEGAIEGRLALLDGQTLEGRFRLRRRGPIERWELHSEAPTPGPARRLLTELSWLEDDGGRALYVGPGEEGPGSGLEVFWRREQGEGFAELALEAVGAGELVTGSRLVDAAQHRGGGAMTARAEAALSAARAQPPPGVDRVALARVRVRERELLELPARFVFQRVQGLPVEAPADLKIDLLREVLHLDGDHAGARQAVRALLPPGLEPAEPFEALDWLDFLEAAVRTQIETFRGDEIRRSKDRELRRVAGLMKRWRPDLVAIRSPQLLVVTPLRAPGRIARTLALGEQVCRHLEQTCSFAGARREQRGRLLLLLYETDEEYREASGMSAAEAEWTSGHYSLRDRLARLYLPADEDGFERVQGTFVHEMTHHWCYERCPLLGDGPHRSGPRTDGFWVIEGFASMIEDLDFDLRRGRYESKALPDALDVLSNAPREAFLDWDRLFVLDNQQFAQLDRAAPHVVPMARWLGRGRAQGETGMFYVQASAACHALFFADRGRHRRALLEYLGAHLTNRAEGLDVQKAFGMTAAQLGQYVERHAREVRAGWE